MAAASATTPSQSTRGDVWRVGDAFGVPSGGRAPPRRFDRLMAGRHLVDELLVPLRGDGRSSVVVGLEGLEPSTNRL